MAERRKVIRLQKYLADCGVASRRAAEKLIIDGQVKVNNQIITQMGIKIDPVKDKVEVGDKKVKLQEKKVYLKLNKPIGIVSSCSDPHETTVLDLIKKLPYRLFPIGRLDKDSQGLILLTNDGDFANKLMHPKYEHEKEYVVNVKLKMTNDKLRMLSEGVMVDRKKTLPAKVMQLSPTKFRITLKEGRNRQIRKMIEAVGNQVVALKRIRIGSIRLGKLPIGSYAFLSKSEISMI